MHIPRIICSPCGLEMTPKQIGVKVEMKDSGGMPYVKVSTDMYGCTECENSVLLPAQAPIAEHWQDNYDSIPVTDTARYRR